MDIEGNVRDAIFIESDRKEVESDIVIFYNENVHNSYFSIRFMEGDISRGIITIESAKQLIEWMRKFIPE